MNRAAPSASLRHFLASVFTGDVLCNEPLSLHTTYRVGGPAEFFVYPRTVEELQTLSVLCCNESYPTFFIGEGANLLVSDNGFRGVVVCLSRYFSYCFRQSNLVTAGAGMLLRNCIQQCEEWELAGLEMLSGIPGTIGGALVMNAGTDQGEIGDAVESVTVLDASLTTRVLTGDSVNFGYRFAPGLHNSIVCEAVFHLKPDAGERIREVREKLCASRLAKQPLEFASCGSVFKRPPNRFVGPLVEKAGLKGYRCGNAEISRKHGGFIVNRGGATAADILGCIRLVQAEIKKRYGVTLEPEVRFLGFEEPI